MWGCHTSLQLLCGMVGLHVMSTDLSLYLQCSRCALPSFFIQQAIYPSSMETTGPSMFSDQELSSIFVTLSTLGHPVVCICSPLSLQVLKLAGRPILRLPPIPPMPGSDVFLTVTTSCITTTSCHSRAANVITSPVKAFAAHTSGTSQDRSLSRYARHGTSCTCAALQSKQFICL